MLHFYKGVFNLLVVYIVSAAIQSCNIVNPKEQVPTYLHIDSVQFSGSHEITAVWVYYNDNPVGTFDLPATIPVIANGTGQLQIIPGVKANGQNDRLVQYPFYTPDVSDFTANPGKVVYYTPKTKYVTAAKFQTISDFEFGQIKFTKSGGNVAITAVTDPALIFEGNGTGGIFLNAVGDSSIDSTNNAFFIPDNPISFIEFDYQCSIPFTLWIQGNIGSLYAFAPISLVGITPTSQWRKFYLNLTGYANDKKASSYNLMIRTSLPENTTSGRVLIDNIKLVTF